MNDKLDSLLHKMQELEKEMMQELRRKETEFLYEVRQRKVRFTEEAHTRHRRLSKRIHRFLLDSTFLVLLTAPIIWFCLIPIAFLDLVITIYQALCFGIYGIPKVRRDDYILLDRHRLAYLNVLEKLNCEYCAYGNGVLAYAAEVAARTEQYWCPIKHALRVKSIHSRYRFFFDYGDAEHYRQQIEQVRRSFEDIPQKSDSTTLPPLP
ncbi:conserved hypothetical protein [Chthoniobacter flavus Ellin428]|uniref:Uncharacterized protein n=1 Tax=Chthoniobacter flavus Ellin428 TaxID=497964 RepID=B4D467_9BACT|nr:hypothetical protein [Chthoniobacter flavus]EDY18668.1 conserved hypothetical protein [Chthoniobacter flavus Ellin428]TCO89093.1 hypothetical protein EV701_115128 [Chthoniobacter flavus]